MIRFPVATSFQLVATGEKCVPSFPSVPLNRATALRPRGDELETRRHGKTNFHPNRTVFRTAIANLSKYSARGISTAPNCAV